MAAGPKPAAADSGRGEVILRGTTICPGIGIGRAHMLDREIVAARDVTEPDQVPDEQQRYTRAIKIAHDQLHEHVEEAHETRFDQATMILGVHEAMLADDTFHDRVRKRIATDHKNAEWALEEEAGRLIRQLEQTRDPYFRARAEDVLDLLNTVLWILSRARLPQQAAAPRLEDSQVLISGHLYGSDAMLAQRSGAAGFATESRASSAHAAILLKGLAIPTVGSVPGLAQAARQGDQVIVDAMGESVILRPQMATLQKYLALKSELEVPPEAPPVQCTTKDRIPVRLMANIENPHQVHLALQNGLEGIGLFRTEFLALTNERLPTEEEQYETYHRVISAWSGRPVVIRTFDIGGDKRGPGLQRCTGENPALGVRGIRRHLLRRPEELRTQLRAILRASPGEQVGALLPMITMIEDVRRAKRHLEIAKDELRAKGQAFSEGLELGAMVEVPAAAVAVREILSEVDFISVGTNDLLQYFMAADRDNEGVLQYGEADNGAFVWLLRFIAEQAAHVGRGKDVMICGEMASRPHFVPLLLELGYRSFSISPVAAIRVRDAITGVDLGRKVDEGSAG